MSAFLAHAHKLAGLGAASSSGGAQQQLLPLACVAIVGLDALAATGGSGGGACDVPAVAKCVALAHSLLQMRSVAAPAQLLLAFDSAAHLPAPLMRLLERQGVRRLQCLPARLGLGSAGGEGGAASVVEPE